MSEEPPAEKQPEQAKAVEVPDPVTQARQYLMKMANLYNMCVACVDKVVAPNVPPIAQTSETFRGAVGSLFIEACRAGFVRGMPAKMMKHDGSNSAN